VYEQCYVTVIMTSVIMSVTKEAQYHIISFKWWQQSCVPEDSLQAKISVCPWYIFFFCVGKFILYSGNFIDLLLSYSALLPPRYTYFIKRRTYRAGLFCRSEIHGYLFTSILV